MDWSFLAGRAVLREWEGDVWFEDGVAKEQFWLKFSHATSFRLFWYFWQSEIVHALEEWRGEAAAAYCTLSYKAYNSWMNRWLNLLTLSFTSTPSQTIQKSLRDLNLPSLDALPHDYLDRLLTKDHPAPTLFAEIVKQLPHQTAPPAVIKLLAFVFAAIRQANYDSNYLVGLEGLQALGVQKGEGGDEQWVREVAVSCRSYLARLPSVGDLFQRAGAAVKNERSTGELSDLYRLMNVMGLLFPHLNSALNTIGRYYMKSSPYFLEFYRTLREELLLGYGYLRLLVDYFLANYTTIDALTLDCFMHSLPEIELLCDRVEEFLMNKYFKGRAPPRKIYFQQDKIDEIAYYLGSHRPKLAQDTGEEELFGEYQ